MTRRRAHGDRHRIGLRRVILHDDQVHAGRDTRADLCRREHDGLTGVSAVEIFFKRFFDTGADTSAKRLAEIVELPDHPFYMAGQFHPELRSRPTRPHPLFRGFVAAALALARTGVPAPSTADA